MRPCMITPDPLFFVHFCCAWFAALGCKCRDLVASLSVCAAAN